MHAKTTLLAAVASILLIGTAIAAAPTKGPAIERFITDDAIGMARINVDKFDINPWIDLAKQAAASQLDAVAKNDLETFRAMAAGVQILAKGAGVRELYLVFDTNEIYRKNLVYAVAFVAEDGKPELLKQLVRQFGGLGKTKLVMREIDGAFVVGTPTTLDRVEQRPTIARPELAGAMAVAKDSPLQVFYLPNRLHRRVFAELDLPLPEELGGESVKNLGAAVQWAAFVADMAPTASLRLVVQAGSEKESQQIRTVIERAAQLGLTQLAAAGGVTPEGKKSVARLKEFIPRLVPQQQGNRLEITVNLTGEGDLLTEILAPVLYAQRAAAHRSQSAYNLKLLGLGLHNYHATWKHLPAVANFDKTGRPLLSWRVHILPYIEQKQLYTEFHLNEPWDSEHNRQLIKRMPKMFRSSSVRALAANGLTSYVLPVGEGTMFPGKTEGLEFKEVTDGLSNTIAILKVADSAAVTWSKPGDWQFDAKNIKHDLADKGDKVLQASFGDGSVRILKTSIDAKILELLLLRNDGQRIPDEY